MAEPCKQELETLSYILDGRAGLNSMYERYAHECFDHNNKNSCELKESIAKSLADDLPIKDSINNLTRCLAGVAV